MKSDGDQAIETSSDDSMADIETVPVYQEVDQNHESTYEPQKFLPPQVVIGRKIFSGDNKLLDSLISSSNEDEEKNDRKSVNFDIGNNSDSQILDNDDIVIEDIIIKTESSPAMTLTPKSPRSPFFPDSSPGSPISICNHSSNNVSAIATLPRVKKKQENHTPLQLMYSAGGVPQGIFPYDKPPPVLEPHIITGKAALWVKAYTLDDSCISNLVC